MSAQAPSATDIDWTLPFDGWGAGLNIRDASSTLETDELQKADNVQLDDQGSIAARLGCRAVGSIPGGVGTDRFISLYPFDRGVSTPQLIGQTNAGKLYYSTDGGATW